MNDEGIRELRRQADKMAEMMRRLDGERPMPLFDAFALAYLDGKLRDPSLREATKRSFKHHVKNHLVPVFGKLPLDKLTNTEWLNWVTGLRDDTEQTRKVTVFFNARKTLTEILRAAKEDGHIEKVPKLDNPDVKKDVGRELSDKEVIAILWKSNRPFRFIFYTFWKMGCRPREILRWEWSMLDWKDEKNCWVNIPARIVKNDRSRSIPINSDVTKRLAIRKRRGNNSLFVFPSRKTKAKPQISYMSAWGRAVAEAKVKEAVPYDFRRTFITKCAIEGRQLLYVAKFLDTSISMIEGTYAKANAAVMEEIAK